MSLRSAITYLSRAVVLGEVLGVAGVSDRPLRELEKRLLR